jgi:hypothetical protein
MTTDDEIRMATEWRSTTASTKITHQRCDMAPREKFFNFDPHLCRIHRLHTPRYPFAQPLYTLGKQEGLADEILADEILADETLRFRFWLTRPQAVPQETADGHLPLHTWTHEPADTAVSKRRSAIGRGVEVVSAMADETVQCRFWLTRPYKRRHEVTEGDGHLPLSAWRRASGYT